MADTPQLVNITVDGKQFKVPAGKLLIEAPFELFSLTVIVTGVPTVTAE